MTETPNATVAVATGPVTLDQGRASEVVPDGSIKLVWQPLIGILIQGKNRLFGVGPVRVSADDCKIEGQFSVIRAGTAGIRALSDGDVWINRTRVKSPSIDHVDIHLLNLPHVQGDEVALGNRSIYGRQNWAFGDWAITMDPVFAGTGLAAAGRASHGNVLTHLVRATRADGKPFRKKHLDQLLETLHLAFSFAFGDHVGAMIAVGRSKTDDVLLELFRPYPTFGWRPRLGPAPTYSGIGSMMHALCMLCAKPDDIVRETIWWYLDACWSMVEASVVLCQASLERIAYHYLVRQTASLEDAAFDRLTAADNIRLVMQVLGVPTKSGTSKLDIPELVTTARNCQVHPRRRGDRVEAIDAHDHALQTVELLVLRLAGYDGVYHPRSSKHAANEVRVPWAR
jgi:hypothetical protein